jgi:predicted alpha/beta-hydrolase family hydrolase
VVGSDAHALDRGPVLGAARDALLAHGIGAGLANDLVDRAARELLERGKQVRRRKPDDAGEDWSGGESPHAAARRCRMPPPHERLMVRNVTE